MQHLADAGNAAGKKFADLLQRSSCAQQVVVIKFAADFERGNLLQRNQQRYSFMLLGNLQAEIGATGNQPRLGMCQIDRRQLSRGFGQEATAALTPNSCISGVASASSRCTVAAAP